MTTRRTTRALLVLAVAMATARPDAAAAQQRRVPRLIGLDTARAIRVLLFTRTLRGVPHTVVYPSAALVPIDSIVDQRPLPDSAVTVGDTIRLVLGARAVVPQLIGRTQPEALRLLEVARLRGQAGTAAASADSDIGRVVRQSDDSGTLVVPFTTIGYFLGSEVRHAMPQLVGLDTARAFAALRPLRGVRHTVVLPNRMLVAIDSIVAQRPDSGEPVRTVDSVQVVLGGRAVVPRLVGRRPGEVAKILEEARLRGAPGSAKATADSEVDRVVRQSIEPGTLVAPGSPVGFDVGTDARIPLPDLRGQRMADALRMLRASGLTTKPETRRESGTGTPVDSVADQDPAPRTPVWPTRSVTLILALRAAPPSIPWLAIAIGAAVIVLVGASLIARAAWVPTVTSRAEPHPYAPRLAVDGPVLVAGDVALRARLESHPSRVAVTGARSLLA